MSRRRTTPAPDTLDDLDEPFCTAKQALTDTRALLFFRRPGPQSASTEMVARVSPSSMITRWLTSESIDLR